MSYQTCDKQNSSAFTIYPNSPIHEEGRRGSTAEGLPFPLIWGTKNMPERTILCCFTDPSHLPPPYGKMYHGERKGAH